MKDLYLKDERNVLGPYSPEQVRQMFISGTATESRLAGLHPDGPWHPLSDFAAEIKSPGLNTEAEGGVYTPKGQGTFDTVVSRFLEQLVARCLAPFWKGDQTARLYESYSSFMTRTGLYAILLCAVLALLVSLILSIRVASINPFASGLLYAGFLVIGHYTAVKFSTMNRDLLRCDVAHLGGDAVPSSLTVGALIVAAGCLLLAPLLFSQNLSSSFLSAAVSLLICLLISFISYHIAILARESRPVLNIMTSREQVSAAQALFGTIKFFARIQLALSFVFLGAGGLVAVFCLVMGLLVSPFELYAAWGGLQVYREMPGYDQLEGCGYGTFGIGLNLALFTALTPLIAYVIYVLAVCLVDLFTAIILTEKNTQTTSGSLNR